MTSPFISDVPAAVAFAAWEEVCAAAGCPPRLPAVRVASADAVGRVATAPIWTTRSSPAYDAAAMDGIAVRAADTIGAGPTTPLLLHPDDFEVVDTGDALPTDRDAVVMREHVHHTQDGSGPRAESRAAAPPYHHVRSIGEDVAAAAAAGATDVLVRRAPVVGDPHR